MQPWLLLGMLGYLSYAISCSIDRGMMRQRRDPLAINTAKMLCDGVLLLIIGVLFFQLHFTAQALLWSLLLGGLYAASGVLYFTSLRLKDVEVVVPYLQSMTLLFIFGAAVLLFRESVSSLNVLGILAIALGVSVLLAKENVHTLAARSVLLLGAGIALLDTLYALLVKHLLSDIEPLSLAVMMYLSTTLLLWAYIVVTKRKLSINDIPRAPLLAASVFGSLGTLLLFMALSAGNASRVYPLAGLQSVFIFIIASLFLRERFSWQRLAGIAMVVMGIYIVSI